MFKTTELPIFNTNVISFGGFCIKWYSLAYIFGVIIAWQMIKFLNKKYNLNLYNDEKKFCDDFFFYGILGIIFGGRLFYILFYNFSYYISNPFEIFALWHGGMSFHGGFLGASIAGYLLCKKYKIDFFKLADVLAVVAPVGLFLGRIANFINLELYGKPTKGNYGFIFPTADNLPRHPTQLYEAFLEGIVLFLIMFFLVKKCKFEWKKLNSSLFLILYGSFRIFIEFFREPDIQIGYFFNFITMGQILSIPLIIVGFYLLINSKKE